MKKLILSLFLITAFWCGTNAQMVDKVTDPVEWMNPLMGTLSKVSLSTGNTYPAITVPWGMNFWSPQTGRMGDGWMYTYTADKIRGFKQTHQPSPWINDFGQFAIMPVTGKMVFDQDERASWFSHKAEVSKPYYYSVYLADHDVTTEITPTERAAMFRFTFPETDDAYVVIDALDRGSYVKIVPGENKVMGYSTRNSGGIPKNFKNYFVIYFDKPITFTSVFKGKEAVNALEMEDNHAGAVIGFKTKKGEKVNARIATSFISFEQAERNMKELGKDDFETVKAKAKKAWNDPLSRIEISGGTIDQIRTFYSCLYRCMFFPHKMYELDEKGQPVHYSPYNGEVLPGRLYTGTGFWDTFRALFPYLNLMHPSMNAEMQEGLANTVKESGFLPEWASPGHRDCMVGSNSASVVADAYLKGLRGYDIDALWQGVLTSSENEGPMTSVGRKGVKYYNSLGYVPYNVGINENAARTLEYAYDDWTAYQLAKELKRPQAEIDKFAKRANNWRNLYDPETKLMRGKNEDGKFQSPFNPFKWGDAFTEGNSWHYSWSVFHDMQGLIDLMGGKKEFVGMLDSVFIMPPVYDESYYGGVIHEIREMQIMNMGQYAHGNQPIQHMTYLYNYAGEPWKSQHWVRETMNRMYASQPDGYCGDEDNGQTSAWYVFSAMGFYPVCPGSDQYVVGTPLFKKMVLKLENGKTITIEAPNNSSDNRYINKMTVNNKVYTKNYLSYKELMKGATINFDMSSQPNKMRGVNQDDFPYSFSTEKK